MTGNTWGTSWQGGGDSKTENPWGTHPGLILHRSTGADPDQQEIRARSGPDARLDVLHSLQPSSIFSPWQMRLQTPAAFWGCVWVCVRWQDQTPGRVQWSHAFTQQSLGPTQPCQTPQPGCQTGTQSNHLMDPVRSRSTSAPSRVCHRYDRDASNQRQAKSQDGVWACTPSGSRQT